MVNQKIFIPFLLIIITILLHVGCRETPPLPKHMVAPQPGDSLIVDTITYEVVIRQIDAEDFWSGENLKYMKHRGLVDYLFDNIYAGQYRAIDIITNEELSTRDVRRMEREKDYNREFVSKLIFQELWYFDSLGIMNKRVHNISLGIEAHSDKGTFLGHRPLLKIEM